MTDYEIRRFQPADRESYLELYETVFGAAPSARWFEWKYGDGNPYVDEPAIFVALRAGDLVGARSFFALRMTTGETTRLALQPSDAMVHPDHRRRGVFSDLTTAALSHYADRDPAFCFNFPNPKSLAGNLNLGWEVVEDVPTYYRVHDPGATADAGPEPLASALRSAASAYYGFRSPEASAGASVTVRRREETPAKTLADLASRSRDDEEDAISAHRDETFYGWRFESPGRSYETFIADRGGESVAALVVGRDTRSGVLTARVVDAVAVGEPADRRETYVALLRSALDANRDAAIVAVRGGLPADVLRRFGFLPDSSPLLSPVASTSTMVARPIGDAGWSVDGRDLREPDNWRLTFAELDSA